MISFESDYITGAHPDVLAALCRSNGEVLSGYGGDSYSASAAEKICAACRFPKADVFFLAGGTQTNAVVLASLLGATEGVIAAESGHIAQHEAGAIEYTGHKVLTVKSSEGKILPHTLSKFLDSFHADGNREHMVQPGAVYISHPTEYGTLYTKKELQELSRICDEYEIPLYLDGARLGYGLAAQGDNLPTLHDVAMYCDVFYIGGTKMGALCGEAVVFPAGAPRAFRTFIKQRGAMLAKGRLLGVQFDALFTDRLYFRIGEHAIAMAMRMKEILLRKGYELYINSPTNQQFPILSREQHERLSKEIAFSFWEYTADGRVVVRLATTWSTTEADLDALEAIL